MKHVFVAGVAITGIMVGSAFAADMPLKAPPPPPPPICVWCGFYIGANIGYGWGSDSSINPSATGNANKIFIDGSQQVAAQLAGLGPIGTTSKGGLGGGQIGYNYQTGAFVWGIETDFSGAHIAGSGAASSNHAVAGFPPFGVGTSVTGSQALDTFGTLRGRLGFTPFDCSLLYFTGGLAYGHASSNIGIAQVETGLDASDRFNPSAGSASRTLTGWTLGAGWEWAFASNWSFKAEYLYYDLGNLNYTANSITGLGGGPPGIIPFTFTNVAPTTEFKGSIFRVGLNWRLGGF